MLKALALGAWAVLLGRPGPRGTCWLLAVVDFGESPARVVNRLRQPQRPDGMDAMTVTIGHLTFDNATYDAEGDVLYLHSGERQTAADSEETPEGHVLRFDAPGRIIGLTIINAKWLVEHEDEITITLPEQVHVEPAALEAALAVA